MQAAGPRLTFSSFYDLTPTVDYLRKVVDFGRLNSGEPRITVAHRPRERGHGAVRQPTRPHWHGPFAGKLRLPPRSSRPSRSTAASWVTGGSQRTRRWSRYWKNRRGAAPPSSSWTCLRAMACGREGSKRRWSARRRTDVRRSDVPAAGRLYRQLWKRQQRTEPLPTILYLSYRPVEGEAGPEMGFDFSQASANDRWTAGRLDMEEALLRHDAAKAGREVVTAIRRR